MSKIIIDADACPVKEEVYRVAVRHGCKVVLVANSKMRAPAVDWLEQVVVKEGLDAADDWIADTVGENDIVIAGDIPLVARCIAKGARVISPRGKIFTEESIGDALATRNLLAQLRELGTMTGGPEPFQKRDRSKFLQSLDTVIQSVKRG